MNVIPRLAAIAAFGVVIGAGLVSPAQAEGRILGADRPDAIPGSYLVVLAGGQQGVHATAEALTDRHGGAVTATFTAALRGFSVKGLDEDAARRLAADRSVAWVEADQVVRIAGTQPNPPSWGLDRIDQRGLPLDHRRQHVGAHTLVFEGDHVARRELRHAAGLDAIIWVPAGRPPHKTGQIVSGDRDRLARLRADLRPRMLASPLCDAAGFAQVVPHRPIGSVGVASRARDEAGHVDVIAHRRHGEHIAVLQRLQDGGNTVVVIEHHLDVILNADHVIDLGPLGGNRGGDLVATGTPEAVAGVAASHTGQDLAPLLTSTGRRKSA